MVGPRIYEVEFNKAPMLVAAAAPKSAAASKAVIRKAGRYRRHEVRAKSFCPPASMRRAGTTSLSSGRGPPAAFSLFSPLVHAIVFCSSKSPNSIGHGSARLRHPSSVRRLRVSVSSVSHEPRSVARRRKFYRFGEATSPDHGTTSSRHTALRYTSIAERSTKRWPLPRATPAPI
jgi:hypothetical protein